jgi:hypothetical protein
VLTPRTKEEEQPDTDRPFPEDRIELPVIASGEQLKESPFQDRKEVEGLEQFSIEE